MFLRLKNCTQSQDDVQIECKGKQNIQIDLCLSQAQDGLTATEPPTLLADLTHHKELGKEESRNKW